MQVVDGTFTKGLPAGFIAPQSVVKIMARA
jgi:hypothetical protein